MAVLKADPQARRKLIIIYCVILAIGIIIIQWGLPALNAFVNQKQPIEAIRILLLALSFCFMPFLPIAIYFYRFGHRILKANQFPPPGEKVIRDTEIIEGHLARRRGRIAILISLFFVLASLMGGLYFPYKLYKLFENHKTIQKVSNGIKEGSTLEKGKYVI